MIPQFFVFFKEVSGKKAPFLETIVLDAKMFSSATQKKTLYRNRVAWITPLFSYRFYLLFFVQFTFFFHAGDHSIFGIFNVLPRQPRRQFTVAVR